MTRHVPATTLETATPALDFERPLESGDDRWVDLESARGGSTLGKLTRLLERDPAHVRIAFTSHRGAGKSTELHRLADAVADQFLAVYFEANVEMDAIQFSMEDLLLVIARFVEETMRSINLPLPAAVLAKVEHWFAETVLSDDEGKSYVATLKTEAKAEGGVPFFAKLTASLAASFKVQSKHSESVKLTLRKFPGALVAHVNELLRAADENLKPTSRRLLLIIDNLDRYEPKLIDDVLIQAGDRFKQLQCSLIVTPPISLLLRPETQAIEDVFTCEVMPTVRLRSKHQDYDEFSGPGKDQLTAALGKRIDLEALMPDVRARERLVAATGGAIRELLEIARDVSLIAAGPTMTLADVEKSLATRRSRLRNRIDHNDWWTVLADIAKNKSAKKDKAYLDVLFQRLAFEYNGDIWYDVHPLVAEALKAKGMLQSTF